MSVLVRFCHFATKKIIVITDCLRYLAVYKYISAIPEKAANTASQRQDWFFCGYPQVIHKVIHK